METGLYAELQILETTDRGLVLDGDELGEIFLSGRTLSEEYESGSCVRVFLYNGSDGEPAATLRTPKITLHTFASLKIVTSSRMGAFAEWGLPKDLYIPITEQQEGMQEEEHYIIRLIHDKKDGRLIGTSRIDRFLDITHPDFQTGEEVDLLIRRKTDLGYNAIINNRHTGMLYSNELFTQIRPGQKLKGYIKKIREDGKIDLSLKKTGLQAISSTSDKILTKLQSAGGFLPLNDKSPAEEIYRTFGESKKSFKKAIGSLYRERKIRIETDGIHLSD